MNRLSDCSNEKNICYILKQKAQRRTPGNIVMHQLELGPKTERTSDRFMSEVRLLDGKGESVFDKMTLCAHRMTVLPSCEFQKIKEPLQTFYWMHKMTVIIT